MERNHFMPRTEPLYNGVGRDLPPADPILPGTLPDILPDIRSDIMPQPRMDAANEEDCGCGGHSHSPHHGECMGHEGCGDAGWGLAEFPLAMVYAPCQFFRALHDPQTALNRGTLFTELDLPFGSTECGLNSLGCVYRAERRRS